jgi:hypothetical protein
MACAKASYGAKYDANDALQCGVIASNLSGAHDNYLKSSVIGELVDTAQHSNDNTTDCSNTHT